jgi:hypothetical protein
MVRYKTLNGTANTGNMEECLTTAFDLQIPPVNDLRGQGGQMVLTLK